MAKDPYKYFRIEARELLEQLASGTLELDQERPASEVVPRLLRLAHTLKGAARVVKQVEIAELMHQVEDALLPFREVRGAVARDQLDAVLHLLEAAGTRVAGLTPPPETAAGPTVAEEPFRTLRTDVAEMDILLDGIGETQSQLGALRRTAATIGRARRLAALVGEQVSSPRTRGGASAASNAPTERAARDLSALVVSVERALQNDIERVERELQAVRSLGERLRLVPVSSLFSVLELAARDAARSLGKRVRFRGEGGSTRLDGHVLAGVQSALVQAVRNAVAHGIEAPAERRTAGKPEEGLVLLEVARRGARIAFTCRDDGRGVDLGEVRRALERKGRLSPEIDAVDDPERLLLLLLQGGITTSRAVTDVSGRGVGLDVVREVAARLEGEVSLRTRRGEGATLELLVPVSLSSVEGLVVEVGGVSAAIPVSAVRETLRVSRDAVASSPEGDSILYQGSVVPFVPLARALAREMLDEATRPVWSTVVVESGARLAAIGVDRLRGHMTLLVRPLPELAPLSGLALGASLDGEGNPQLVLDPDALAEAARRSRRAALEAPVPRPPILVVDDSLTTRRLEQSILESAGYAVELASSGEEALEKARQHRYSLFLVDVEMPGMDGFAVLEHLRADAALRGIPALLVTSRSSPADRARGRDVGARAYIVKGEFDQVELLDQIRALVG